MRNLLAIAALCVAATLATAAPLRTEDREFLEDAGSVRVAASLQFNDEIPDDLLPALSADRYLRLSEIATLVVHAPAHAVLAAASRPSIRVIEIIDDDMEERVAKILHALHMIGLQQGVIHQLGALNISLGVQRVRLNTHRSAEQTMQRALEHLVRRRQIPVVLSLGNDGPAPDLVNPWALAKGVIAAAAAGVDGKELWSGSSRFKPGAGAGHDVFAAHGYLSIGPWAAGTPKTNAMLEAEKKVNLTKIVGEGNEKLYRVDSGTSYAAAEITRAICQIHQAVHLLRLQASATSPLDGTLPQFVRGYIDTGVDASHPAFKNRLADRTPMNGGLPVKFSASRRQALHQFVRGGARLDLSYGPQIVLALLKHAAKPVPNTNSDETGYGFVSRGLVADALRELTYVDFINLFSLETGARLASLQKQAASLSDPLFLPDEVSKLGAYCDGYDLVLMLRVP